ncbi:MAG TPA: pirin family protein [Roseiarcus sp.]|jgi:hypothetical protein
MSAFERAVLRIDRPQIQQGMSAQHRVRALMPAAMRGDFAATDPFLALMEDWFPRGVFDKHPHRGIETVTYVLEGRLDHYDNQGNAGSILPGDAQWMTAGRGLIHNEIPAEGVIAHTLQLWVHLPAAHKMAEPRYQDLHGDLAPMRREPRAEARVFSGASGGIVSSTRNYAPVTMVEFRLDPGGSIRQDLPADYNAVLVLLSGEASIGRTEAHAAGGDVVWLTRREDTSPSEFTISAPEQSVRALLYAGRPLREPVVARGPFVMNSEAEIEQAYADYRAGRFGRV